MATYTSHLNLKLPDYSDVADVKDLNDNFKKIDDAIASGGTGGGTGGITKETDPTVPAWAKQPNKPTYTASEVGALPNTTVIPTVPSALPNPQPIIINGVSYDGREKKEINIQAEGGGVVVETDPTVPDWAKQPRKPIYTASEVGALPDTYKAPVQSVNGKTGAVTLIASDVGALPNTTEIPIVPEKLPNPQPIVINGVIYDGSERKEVNIQAEGGGIVTETDPTVPAWAKAEKKPSYTAEEVGALPSTYEPPVKSVNGKTGEVSLVAADVGALPDTYNPPVKSVNGKTGDVALVASDVGALPDTTVIPIVPTALKNPYPLTINGVAYDGSEAKTINIQASDDGESVSLDTTLTQYGMAADAGAVGNALEQERQARENAVEELNDKLTEQKEANAAQDERLTALEQTTPSGTSGLTTAQVNALDGMFNVVAYDGDKDYAAAYQAFKSAFGIVTMYTVKNNLTNVTSDNDATVIPGGSAYTATLTVASGYTMSAVFVYMGGVDVTSTAYANGMVTIESVTGDIVISATATVAGVTTYTITNNLTNATSSNPAVSIEEGAAYSATITPDEEYTLTGGTVSVTMGGTDVTSTVYADGTITIASVTGDVVISVTAVEESFGGEVVMLTSITGDGASWIDTEFTLTDSTHTMELSAKLADGDATTLMGADGYNVGTSYGKTAVWTNDQRYLSGSLNQGGFANVGTWNSNVESLASIQFYLVLADGLQIIYKDAEHTSQYGDKTSVKYGTSHEFVPIPLYLFTANRTKQANVNYTPSDCTIYFFKITDADGNVVLNLVPAKQGGKVGMYDTVAQKFHENQGTGTFSYEEVSA